MRLSRTRWPEPVARVARFLSEARVEARLEEFPEGTPTADDAADAAGCELDADRQVARLPLRRAPDPRRWCRATTARRPARRSPRRRAASTADGRPARGSSSVTTGFQAGGVAPFPLPRDRDRPHRADAPRLGRSSGSGAGSPRHMAALAPGDLVRLSRARRCALVRECGSDTDKEETWPASARQRSCGRGASPTAAAVLSISSGALTATCPVTWAARVEEPSGDEPRGARRPPRTPPATRWRSRTRSPGEACRPSAWPSAPYTFGARQGLAVDSGSTSRLRSGARSRRVRPTRRRTPSRNCPRLERAPRCGRDPPQRPAREARRLRHGARPRRSGSTASSSTGRTPRSTSASTACTTARASSKASAATRHRRGPAVFRLTDHMRRLDTSAALIYMKLPYSVDELVARDARAGLASTASPRATCGRSRSTATARSACRPGTTRSTSRS